MPVHAYVYMRQKGRLASRVFVSVGGGSPSSSLTCHPHSLPFLLSSLRTASTVSVVAFLASTMSTDSPSC